MRPVQPPYCYAHQCNSSAFDFATAILYNLPASRPAAGFDLPAVHTLPLSVLQTSWQLSNASCCKPSLPLHEPFGHWHSLWLYTQARFTASWDASHYMQFIWCTWCSHCVCLHSYQIVFVLLYQIQTRMLSHKSLVKWQSLKFLLYLLFLCHLIENSHYCDAFVLDFPPVSQNQRLTKCINK